MSADGVIRITVTLDSDEVNDGLKDINGQVKDAAADAGSLGEKLRKGLATAAKVGAAAVGAAATGVAALTKSALASYANYEQLVGGVDTLFKESSKTVQEYAANAYKTAGMSANQYMETVTGFSASLLQSLGGDTAKAAQTADQAIIDMSDNANKMGTSMEAIQNAYQGFAKQNYTMLDNLKLGYGGTKEEMERLLADAQAISGIEYDISSYADVVNAIHVIQTEMGITGTTAKEASTTIQGSIASMGSAWSNLVTGIADDNADLDLLIDNFVNSVSTVGENIIPRLEVILGGIGDLIVKMAPVISAQLPVLIEQVLPSLLEAGTSLLTGLISGVVAAAPALVDAAVSTLTTLATYLIENLPMLVAAAGQIVSTLVTSIGEALPQILDAGAQMLDQLVSGIETGLPDMISRLPQIIDDFLNFISDSLPNILDKGVEMLNKLVDGIIGAIPDMVAALPEIITSITNFFAKNYPKIIEAGVKLLVNLVTGIIKAIPELVKSLPKIITAIVNGIGALMSSIVNIGKNIVSGIWQGIQNMMSWFTSKVKGFFSGIVNGVKGLLGIHSPSKVFASIGGYMGEGLANGIDASAKTAVKAAGAMAEAVTNAGMPQLGDTLSNFKARLRLAAMPSLPSLTIPNIARGAVIPANPTFASAVQGTGGIDMEALSATVGAAVRNAMGRDDNNRVLREILSAVKAGHEISVDGMKFGKVAVKTINDYNTIAGGQKLKI